MAKFKPLSRVLERVFRNNRSRRKRRTTSSKSRRWISAIWRRRERFQDDSAEGTGLPRRRYRLLPSFSCFKKKKYPARCRRSFEKEFGRGGRLLRLMSSFLKKRDEPACTQENLAEINETNPRNSYILSMGGISIVVEPYYHPTDHTAADSASVYCHQTDYMGGDCNSSMSTEPDTAARSQDVEDIFSDVTVALSPTSCTREEVRLSDNVAPPDSDSSFESPISSDNHSFCETQQSQPQSFNKQNVKCELVYRKEGDNETIFQMEQSIARIERISHQFCYPKHKRSSVCIRQDYKVTTDFITCTWQWITAVSMVFILILLM